MKARASFAKLAGIALLAGCLIPARGIAAQQTRADADQDPVLKAMLEEMDRSMADLELKGFAKPFFIQYRIEDVDDFETHAEFGASEGVQHTHQRIARVTVRIGDHKTDSSGGRGDGSLEITGLGSDPISIRSALWDATDSAYKNALAAFAQKQAALKDVQTQPQADDFSEEKPVVALAAPAVLNVDENAWAGRMAQVSGFYRTSAAVKDHQREIEYSNASFHARATTTYLVSSEGTIVRKAATEFQESFAVGTQAEDGMRLDRSYASTARSIEDLDSPRNFESRQSTILLHWLSCARRRWWKRSITGRCCSALTPAPTRCARCLPAQSLPHGRHWEPRPAPTALSLPVFMRAFCPISST